MARFVKPEVVQPERSDREIEVDPSDFMSHYPTLLEFLTLTRWDDGSPRETATLTLFQGPDGLQAALNDRDGGLVAFATGRSFTALLGAFEAGLSDGSLQWRVAKGRAPSKKR